MIWKLIQMQLAFVAGYLMARLVIALWKVFRNAISAGAMIRLIGIGLAIATGACLGQFCSIPDETNLFRLVVASSVTNLWFFVERELERERKR